MAIPTSAKAMALYIFLAASILPSGGGSIAQAQDAAGSTPPELRDFRLDPPPSETAPAPQVPGPEVRSPPQAPPPRQAPEVPPENVTPASVIQRPAPTAAEPSRVAPRTTGESAQDSAAEPQTAPSINAKPSPLADPDPDIAETQTEPDPLVEPEPSGMDDLGFAAMAALLMAIGAAGWFLWRWRTKAASVPAAQPLSRKFPSNARQADPRPHPAPAAAPRLVSMNFVPENAVVSFTSLNIQGKLHITNPAHVGTDELALRTVLISASSDQQDQMDSFFADPGQNAAMPLVAIKAGDSITVPLKVGVSLRALQAFSLQEKTMLAPILLARLVAPAQDGTEQEVARLVCMIGREFSPPKARMGPLRLDQGPRSFDHLGQRALVS